MKQKLLVMLFVGLIAYAGHAQTLRLLTYNIRHAQNEAGQINVKDLADFILKQNPDVVALQEVDSVCGRSAKLDIAAELGKLTGMYYYFGKAMDYDGGGYGEALLSKLPIEKISTVPLPFQPNKKREPRAAIEAILVTKEGTRFKFITTHLDHLQDETDRLMQTNYLAEKYAGETMPFIIGGDLNAKPEEKAMVPLLGITNYPGKDKMLFTFPSGTPDKKIDYFLLSRNHQWKCIRFDVLPEKQISDHRPVIMEIKL
jgi:endonuclease/exonuclease/phosphatase family metal-dependent hydrolase